MHSQHVRDDAAQQEICGESALEQCAALRHHLEIVGPDCAFEALAEHLHRSRSDLVRGSGCGEGWRAGGGVPSAWPRVNTSSRKMQPSAQTSLARGVPLVDFPSSGEK